jgi:hypothetical protein
VGVVALTRHFSGAVARNQVLLAGGNPVFVLGLGECAAPLETVDILLVLGGIDCADAAPLLERLRRFDARRFRFGRLVYAGNKSLTDDFLAMNPDATIIDNPLAEGLATRDTSIFEALRRAYLDDLVHKDGIAQIRPALSHKIRPTPEVVSRGFLRALHNKSGIKLAGACVLMDIGGATTDVHYTVEIVRDDSLERPFEGSSVARYVFVDLGVVASYETTVLQLRTHPRLFEFLSIVTDGDVRETYRQLREGDYRPSSTVLSYACYFLALDRFATGSGPGLPTAELSKMKQVVLSGGAAQSLDESLLLRLLALHVPKTRAEVLIDRKYQIWIDGITWMEQAPVARSGATAPD